VVIYTLVSEHLISFIFNIFVPYSPIFPVSFLRFERGSFKCSLKRRNSAPLVENFVVLGINWSFVVLGNFSAFMTLM